MASITYSATLFARRYSSSSNYLTDRAAQGATSSNGNIVGVINFRSMNLANKTITGITLITTCTSEAGLGNWATKTLKFKECTTADPTNSSSGTGASFVGNALGSLSSENFYNASNVLRVIDPASTLCAKLKVYFESGAHTVVLYAADSTPSSGYSDNYLFLDGVKLVIMYEEGLVYLGVDGVFQKCQVYHGC